MMKFFVFLAASLFLAATAVLVSAGALPLYKWELHPNQSPIADSELFHNIKFFLPLRNERLLNEMEATPSTAQLQALAAKHDAGRRCAVKQTPLNPDDEVSVRLALWRRILHPGCNTIAAAADFLHSRAGIALGEQCVLDFDQIRCDGLTVRQVQQLFRVKKEHIRRVHETRAKTVFAPRLSIGKEIGADLAKIGDFGPNVFSFIGGLAVGTEQQQPRSHMAVADSEMANKQEEAAGANPPPFNPGFFPPRGSGSNAPSISNFASHTITSSATENFGSYFFSGVVTDLPCQDGSMSSISADGVISCGGSSGASGLPVAIKVRVARSSDDVTLQSETVSLNFTGAKPSCTHANATGTGPASAVSCPLALTKQALPLWQPVVVGVKSVFPDNSESAWNFMRAYYNSSFFGFSNVFPQTAQATQTGRLPLYNMDDVTFQVTPGRTSLPEEWRSKYGVPSDMPPTTPAARKGKVSDKIVGAVLEFPGGGGGGGFGNLYNKTDLITFVKRIGGDSWFNEDNVIYMEPKAGFGPTSVPAKQGAPGESQLDIQALVGATRGLKSAFWVFNATNNNFAIDGADWLQLVLTQKGALQYMKYTPTTWSVSYGSTETSDAPSVAAYRRSQTYAAAASSAGISIHISSGDAGSSPGQTWPSATLQASYPANLPAVISVGATANRADKNGNMFTDISSALLGDLITSGGGPSDVLDVPVYQRWIYETGDYAKLPAHLGWGKAATPTISAIGAMIMIVLNGKNLSVSGTSASSPISMALLTLVNNELALRGMPPLRDVSKFYSSGADAMFQNVITSTTTGSARGFANNIACYKSISWTGNKGYNFATGYGTPIFGAILEAALVNSSSVKHQMWWRSKK